MLYFLSIDCLLAPTTRYEKTVQDYNFGTLLRINCNKDYDQDNTMFGNETNVAQAHAAIN